MLVYLDVPTHRSPHSSAQGESATMLADGSSWRTQVDQFEDIPGMDLTKLLAVQLAACQDRGSGSRQASSSRKSSSPSAPGSARPLSSTLSNSCPLRACSRRTFSSTVFLAISR